MIPDTINLVNVTDTCAVWHLVGADTLFRTARRLKIAFIITSTVFYECFVKTRGRPLTIEQRALRERLQEHIEYERVSQMNVTIEDLQEALELARRRGFDKRLGQGEFSCIALVRRLGHSAVLTDNKRDFRAIEALVENRLQTTPRLLGWLYVEGHLSDSDVDEVIREHESSNGDMAKVYRQAHVMACEKRLMRRMDFKDESGAIDRQ